MIVNKNTNYADKKYQWKSLYTTRFEPTNENVIKEPKSCATHYYEILGLPCKGPKIKGFVVCNSTQRYYLMLLKLHNNCALC